MSYPLILACFWVFAASAVAFLPMRRQFAPGLILLIVAPLLVLWIGIEHGWMWMVAASLAVISLFRRPLWYLLRRLLGKV
ncbi:DUF2484 family protein [Aliiroseovarius sp. KMU-50]|uniref:DUF2484 family protein n=1 Tax=Aliiroseovarius salicola TaxID=3009082 RepID=A0ABT4W1S7_9RHOB|nr:DUF2484 family protein [Aliiroseovarius sp. KMU-50]MDA5094468.1 DUF2484 family protein [Aliiroseovarius sp. KMU-50]